MQCSIYVFSMISLGCTLISDLVVANLFMHSLLGMILLYLAPPFLHWRCFCMRFTELLWLFSFNIHTISVLFTIYHTHRTKAQIIGTMVNGLEMKLIFRMDLLYVWCHNGVWREEWFQANLLHLLAKNTIIVFTRMLQVTEQLSLTLACTILVCFPLIFSCYSWIACMSFYTWSKWYTNVWK